LVKAEDIRCRSPLTPDLFLAPHLGVQLQIWGSAEMLDDEIVKLCDNLREAGFGDRIREHRWEDEVSLVVILDKLTLTNIMAKGAYLPYLARNVLHAETGGFGRSGRLFVGSEFSR
jgi:hypothetical protein